MKEMNRREFLTLYRRSRCGALAGRLRRALRTPAPPAAPTGKEAELLAAINKVWKEKFDAGAVDHEQLTLNQEARGAIKIQGGIFEETQENRRIS